MMGLLTIISLGVLLLGPFVAEGAIKKVSSSGELESALASARPYDTIQLANGVYQGDFVISSDGPITLTGDVNSTIVSEGTGLTIKGNKWTVKSVYIKEPNIGVLVEGNENNVDHVVIQKVKSTFDMNYRWLLHKNYYVFTR